MTGCNIEHAKLIIEQKDITEKYTGVLMEENLTFRIHYNNNINYDEPVNMKIYFVSNDSDSGCKKYLQTKNIKLRTVSKEMKIYEADISKFAILNK